MPMAVAAVTRHAVSISGKLLRSATAFPKARSTCSYFACSPALRDGVSWISRLRLSRLCRSIARGRVDQRVLDHLQKRLASRPAADGFSDNVREIGPAREDDLLLQFKIVEQAAARDAGGLGDIVQGRGLETALQKQANGLGLNPGISFRALALTQAGWDRFLHCLHYCTVCSITRSSSILPRKFQAQG